MRSKVTFVVKWELIGRTWLHKKEKEKKKIDLPRKFGLC